MPQFKYRARRASGELVQDVIDAPDRTTAITAIQRLGLAPSFVGATGEVARKPERSSAKPTTASAPTSAFSQSWFVRKRKPKLQELATFTRQLNNLLRAGMPLAYALNSMSNLGSKGIPSDVSKQLRQDVMEGKGLSDGMARQPDIFSDLYVNMVRAGEQSGALSDVLERLASHFERFAEVRQTFVSAMIYPAIVCVVGVIIIFVFMTVMLPRFTSIFQDMKQVEMPWATQVLIGFSHYAGRFWWMAPALLLVGYIIYVRYRATEAGARKIDELKLQFPVVGNVLKLNLFGQFARTLGTLLQNGVPVLTALKITEQVIPNRIIREAIALTREDVTDGKTISQPLARSKIFPQLMIDLIRIGEETGDVPNALNNVAQTYENEMTVALRVMTNLIQPAMIIVMALGVGFLLFSILTAIFTITANIGQ